MPARDEQCILENEKRTGDSCDDTESVTTNALGVPAGVAYPTDDPTHAQSSTGIGRVITVCLKARVGLANCKTSQLSACVFACVARACGVRGAPTNAAMCT